MDAPDSDAPDPDASGPDGRPSDERWRRLLIDPSAQRRSRRIHSRIPSQPRCKLCAAPFGGIGGLVMPLFGHPRWAKNPKFCAGCFGMLSANHGGAEVECSLLFADVRNSTAMAEAMSPREFNRVMGRFHDVAFETLVGFDAFVDKFVGDEIIGIFVPSMAGEGHALRAVSAARALLAAIGHGTREGGAIPVGAGVSTGIAYVGSIGEGPDTDLTAMGDLVNTTARLASAAGAGEILVTAEAATSAGLPPSLDRRTLNLKGKRLPTEVVVVTESV